MNDPAVFNESLPSVEVLVARQAKLVLRIDDVTLWRVPKRRRNFSNLSGRRRLRIVRACVGHQEVRPDSGRIICDRVRRLRYRDILVRDATELFLVLLWIDVVHIVEVKRDVFKVVLHFGVADAAEEVLGVNLALAILRLVVVQREIVDLDDVLPDVSLFARQLVANGALEPAFVPTRRLSAVVKKSPVHQS